MRETEIRLSITQGGVGDQKSRVGIKPRDIKLSALFNYNTLELDLPHCHVFLTSCFLANTLDLTYILSQ
jgi:hypothetical protein